jgi:hypothetical protein
MFRTPFHLRPASTPFLGRAPMHTRLTTGLPQCKEILMFLATAYYKYLSINHCKSTKNLCPNPNSGEMRGIQLPTIVNPGTTPG